MLQQEKQKGLSLIGKQDKNTKPGRWNGIPKELFLKDVNQQLLTYLKNVYKNNGKWNLIQCERNLNMTKFGSTNSNQLNSKINPCKMFFRAQLKVSKNMQTGIIGLNLNQMNKQINIKMDVYVSYQNIKLISFTRIILNDFILCFDIFTIFIVIFAIQYYIFLQVIIVMGKHKIFHYGFPGAMDLFQIEIVSKKIRGIGIENKLRNIAIEKGLASLSSPLIGQSWNALIILKNQYLKPSKWNNYSNLKHSSFDTYYNSKLLDQTTQTTQDWQECCGYPGVRLLIPRPKKIKITYESQKKFELFQTQLKDFQARLFHHELHHLQSIDPLKKANGIQIIDEKLRLQNQTIIKNLFEGMLKERQKYNDKDNKQNISNMYKSRPKLNQLRRQIAFTITQFYRK